MSAVAKVAPLTYESYLQRKDRFAVDKDLVRRTLASCEPQVIRVLGPFAQRHVWQGGLPYHAVMRSPKDNGGWGHLMPMWFNPSERPVPYFTLNNWALFSLVYEASFGPSHEAREMAQRHFHIENLVRVVGGSNLALPFLPSTQGVGLFLRHGMLPYLLAILWLPEADRRGWLRLHELAAQRFINANALSKVKDIVLFLRNLEFEIFGHLEGSQIDDERSVSGLLAGEVTDGKLRALYESLFGAIGLGLTGIATLYRDKPLEAWDSWAPQELAYSYRLPEYGAAAIESVVSQLQ